MKRHCTQRGESGGAKIHIRRKNSSHQQAGNTSKLRVDRMTGTSACDAITGIDVANAFAHRDYGSGAAVSQRARLLQAIAHRRHRRHQSVSTYFAENRVHQIGPHARFLQKTLAGKLGRRPLCARRNQ